jgi:hypothetical protein
MYTPVAEAVKVRVALAVTVVPVSWRLVVSREAVRPVDVPPESGKTEGVASEIVPVKPY